MSNSGSTHSVTFGVGSVLAMAMSYYINHSVGWLILHMFCGWIYVVYSAFHYSEKWWEFLEKIGSVFGA